MKSLPMSQLSHTKVLEDYLIFMTGYQSLLSLFALLVIGPYIVLHLKDWRTPHLNYAIASFLYIFGNFGIRSGLWVVRYAPEHGIDISGFNWLLFLNISDAIAIIGLVCKVRVLGEPTWGPNAWIWFTIAAIILAVVALL